MTRFPSIRRVSSHDGRCVKGARRIDGGKSHDETREMAVRGIHRSFRIQSGPRFDPSQPDAGHRDGDAGLQWAAGQQLELRGGAGQQREAQRDGDDHRVLRAGRALRHHAQQRKQRPRAILLAGAKDFLDYDIFVDPEHAKPWHDGIAINTFKQVGIGNGSAQQYTAYGEARPQTSQAAGNYSDSVEVDLNF